jgi:hypothetical protein
MQEIIQQIYPHLMPEEVTELVDSTKNVMMLAVTLNPKGVTAILGPTFIYLKAGYAFGFSDSVSLVFVFVIAF